MRRKIEELKTSIQEFVDQSDNLALVVNGTDTEILYAIKSIEAVEQENGSDLFLTFPRPLATAEGYLQDLFASLEAQVAGSQELQRAKGLPEWPPFPAACKDPQAEIVPRLRMAFDYVRDLLPREEDHRVVLGLLPTSIKDPREYANLVGAILPHGGFAPWMRRLRIVLRDTREQPFLIPYLERERIPGVMVLDIDLGTAALTSSLADDAADPGLPKGERMEALLQLAALDYAYKRYPQAIEKYRVLYDHYSEEKNPALQALCLQGVGDVLRRLGKSDQAKERYQQALAIAVPTGAFPLMLNLLAGTGELCLERKEFAEAEGYLALADPVAAKLINPFAKCDVMEKLGMAREAQKNYAGAVDAWRRAAVLCKEVEYLDRWKSVLERLLAVYRQTRRPETAAFERELSDVRERIKNRSAA